MKIGFWNKITQFKRTQNITLANREGRKVIYQGQDGRKRLEVWTIKNQKAYIVTYTAEADKFKKFSKQADNIIQSLEIKREEGRGNYPIFLLFPCTSAYLYFLSFKGHHRQRWYINFQGMGPRGGVPLSGF